MSSSSILQILLFVQIFVLGGLVAYAVQYYRKHYGPQQHIDIPMEPVDPEEVLPPEVKRRLIEESELKIQSALNRVAGGLNHDLEASAIEINRSVHKLAGDIVAGEMDRYRQRLALLHQNADKQMGAIQAEVAKHEEQIKARVTAELAAEKQRLVSQLDTKLGDAVASFLNETLRHNVDLGNQTQYLIAMLEEHKADFIKEVKEDEAGPAQ